VRLAVLDPEYGLPDTIPINPEVELTVLFFRGRQIAAKLEENANLGPLFFRNFAKGPSDEYYEQLADPQSPRLLALMNNNMALNPNSVPMISEIEQVAIDIASVH
jgi:hypothetical protein